MIYDVFNFFDELELLEIRLGELGGFVDKFVLVESATTFQNNKKELIYEKNKDLFKAWHDKIIHIVIEDSPNTQDTWVVEEFQFNAGRRGTNAKENDFILWNCTDEIPKKESVKKAIETYTQPAMFLMYSIGGYLNCLNTHHDWWTGGRLIRGDHWNNSNSLYMEFRKHWLHHHVPDAGWHFCNCGGAERYKEKIKSYAHKELNHDSFLADIPKKIEICYNLEGAGMELMPWDKMPKYILENKEKFKHMLIPDDKKHPDQRNKSDFV